MQIAPGFGGRQFSAFFGNFDVIFDGVVQALQLFLHLLFRGAFVHHLDKELVKNLTLLLNCLFGLIQHVAGSSLEFLLQKRVFVGPLLHFLIQLDHNFERQFWRIYHFQPRHFYVQVLDVHHHMFDHLISFLFPVSKPHLIEAV